MAEFKSYTVWDAPTRSFHWINVLCIIGLSAVGFVILYAGDLGVPNNGKASLKTVHVWIGYVFAANLIWRFVWAFLGNRHARWGSFLPGGRGYPGALRSYLAALRSGHPQQYLGHNPLGRISVAVLLLLLLIQAVTGLVLAGTDLFYPPIGHWIAQWVAASGVDPASLLPYSPEMVDKTAWDSMRAFRKPFAVTHLYSFWTLVAVIAVHIAAVVITDMKEGGSIISAMFTGRKILTGPPADEDKAPRN
jgi:Ni/Fe-hydrogenase 1 B-type cytochrome subunit